MQLRYFLWRPTELGPPRCIMCGCIGGWPWCPWWALLTCPGGVERWPGIRWAPEWAGMGGCEPLGAGGETI